jgi:NADPH-dependent ferric siderophore reductase
MARITLSGPAFADFGVTEPGEIITLGWASPGEELVLPEGGWRFPRGTPEQHWRNYTVRRHDPARAEVEIDFALHDDAGQATRWAADAKPGDRAGFAGPRTHWERDPDADWALLVADDTGVPAALAILESLPAGHRAIALLEVADERERQPIATPADVDVRWLSRDGRAPGTTTLLPDAVREVDLPPGRGRVWGAGESHAMRRVRDHVRRGRGLEKVNVLGYWAVSRSSNGTSSSRA